MPFHPRHEVDAYAGFGVEPGTNRSYWTLTLSTRDVQYQKIFLIRLGTDPDMPYIVSLYSHETVPYIPLDSHILLTTHDPRSLNLLIAGVKRLPGWHFQIWIDRVVGWMEKMRPAPRAQLGWRHLAPEEPAEPARRVQSALRGIKTVFTAGYERIRHTGQRVRFARAPEIPGRNTPPQPNHPEATPPREGGGRNPAPPQEMLHEMRVIWTEPAQPANQVRQVRQAHESCCVIVGSSLAISTLTTIVHQYRIIGGYVLFCWFAIFCFHIDGPAT